jgi:hypothetical protein
MELKDGVWIQNVVHFHICYVCKELTDYPTNFCDQTHKLKCKGCGSEWGPDEES